jgi:ABC-type bacteriocin/lantibiotic exporter with double-glycine peptidase domain
MLFTFHGYPVSLADIRADIEVRPDGVSLLELATAARRRGFRANAFALAAADLRLMPLPAIAHWNGRHFVVVERLLPNGAQIVDPALGRRTMPAEAFAVCFSGAMMTLAPETEVITAPLPRNAPAPPIPHGSTDRPWPDRDHIGKSASS